MGLVRGDRIGESQRLNACSIETQNFYALFCRVVPDDFGRFRATPAHVALRMYPRREPTPDVLAYVARQLEELRQPPNGAEPLWRAWEVDGVVFGELTGWLPTGNRYHRAPEPEWSDHVHRGPCLATAIARARDWKQPDVAAALSNQLKELRDRRRTETQAKRVRKATEKQIGLPAETHHSSPPSPSSPLTKFATLGASRPRPTPWTVQAVDIYRSRFPGAERFEGRINKALHPLVQKYGWDRVGPDWKRYVMNPKETKITAEWFVQHYLGPPLPPQPVAEPPLMTQTPQARDAWAKLLVQLEAKLEAHAFATWLRPTFGVQIQPDKLLIVAVPPGQHRDWIQKNFGELVSEVARAAGFVNVKFIVGKRPVGV